MSIDWFDLAVILALVAWIIYQRYDYEKRIGELEASRQMLLRKVEELGG